MIKKQGSPRFRLGALVAGLTVLATSHAGSATYNFDSDPAGVLDFVGNAYWQPSGGNPGGYMDLLDAVNSQYSAVLIPDFDQGMVVKAFTFEVDLRIGNAVGNDGRPADGFSISYCHADDPVIAVLEGGSNAQNQYAVDGGPEMGTKTGLVLSFDTWSGNTEPDGGTDLEGLVINVDSKTLTINGQRGVPLPTRNGSCTDATSLQTGPYDPTNPGDPSGLCWAHLKCELDEQGKVTVTWKGTVIVDHLATGFSPTAGRLVFAGRTGGANENTHIDNLSITTIPADSAVIGNPTGVPDGFDITVTDSGPSVFDPAAAGSIVEFKLNGTAITATSTSKTGSTSTLSYRNPASPIAPGTTNTVNLTVKDSRGVTSTATKTFVEGAYTTLDPTWAATGVDKSKPGFVEKIYQVDATDDLGVQHVTDNANNGVSVASGERMLHGDLGANTADLTLFTGTGQTYTETAVINYNAFAGNLGDYADDGSLGTPPSPNLPGLPGTAVREGGNDDVTMEIVTYIEFPKAGSYQLGFNSDDGFRTIAGANPKEQLTSAIVSQFDNGRGAANTIGWVYVPTPGIYPLRSIWMEGGGGANLEWWAINPDGVKALINDSTTPGALKAYSVNNGAMPAAVTYADPPRGSGRQVSALYPVTFEITDGAAPVSNIKLTINGVAVTPTITKSGSVSKVVYNDLLPRNQTVTAVVSFTDGAKTYTGSNSFSVGGGAVVPPSMALNASDVNKSNPGFLIKTWQTAIMNNGATTENSPGNSTLIAEAWVHSFWGWPNTADLTAFTGPGGSYQETTVINYNGASGNIGTFVDDGTYGLAPSPNVPGIPGSSTLESGFDNYALEIRTVLDLQPGIYQMGVNSDDGFRLIVGDGKEAYTLPIVCGEYDGGRGADNWGFTRFAIKITQAGLYPFRLVFEEGGGGNNVEWFTIQKPWQPDQIGKVLINDLQSGAANPIKAYQYPINSTGPTYVKSFAPGRSSLDTAGSVGRAGPDATVTAVLVDGSTPVDTTKVSMTINGTAVTPTATKSGTTTTVTYKPAGGFAPGSTNAVALTFGDRTVNWTFIVGLPATPTFWIEAADYDYNGGQTKAEASVMPYMGAAYAGLAGLAGTDYVGPWDNDNPYYRYPNTQGVPMSFANDRDRGGGEVMVDFRLGWMGGAHWLNYTRNIPAGKYNVYAALSSGTAGDHIYGNLAQVSGGTQTILGVFDSTAPGGWGNNALLPLKDAATTNSVVALDLGGTTTLRYNDGSGDWDFMLLTPAVSSTQAKFTGIKKNADGTITVEWTGGGTLQAAPAVTGPWQDVPGATSPYTLTPTAAMLFGRIRQ